MALHPWFGACALFATVALGFGCGESKSKPKPEQTGGPSTALSCPKGLTQCGDACVSTRSDADHCGVCGKSCAEGQVCSRAECAARCADGLTECSEACIDATSDRTNCGACGESCAASEVCTEGACTSCVDATLKLDAPALELDTRKAKSRHEGACAAGNAPDRAALFEAPEDGFYRFDTDGSTYNTVVSLLRGGCGGEELTCADDTAASVFGAATAELKKGDTVLAVVDGAVGQSGEAKLRVSKVKGPPQVTAGPCCAANNEPGCADTTIAECVCAQDDTCCKRGWDELCVGRVQEFGCGSCVTCSPMALELGVPQLMTGSTLNGPDSVRPSCAVSDEGSPEATFTFVAPKAALYAFDTLGSSYDTSIAILDGTCGGAELACNDDAGKLPTSRAQVRLAAGQQVIVVVDGYGGSQGEFVLNVDEGSEAEIVACCAPQATAGCGADSVESCVCARDDYCCKHQWDASCVDFAADCGYCGATNSQCKSVNLGSTVPQEIDGELKAGNDFNSGSCGPKGGSEALYAFEAPKAGYYAIDTAGSSVDTVLYVLQTDCKGLELACNDDLSDRETSRVTLKLVANENIMIAVDGSDATELGAIKLSIKEVTTDGANGDCCAPHGTPGCSNATISACVCMEDSACCEDSSEWDDLCIAGVKAFGCGTCE